MSPTPCTRSFGGGSAFVRARWPRCSPGAPVHRATFGPRGDLIRGWALGARVRTGHSFAASGLLLVAALALPLFGG